MFNPLFADHCRPESRFIGDLTEEDLSSLLSTDDEEVQLCKQIKALLRGTINQVAEEEVDPKISLILNTPIPKRKPVETILSPVKKQAEMEPGTEKEY